MKATVFRIQRFSVHDGPGIRTTVFFKGCPLRCRWCHNPEGLSSQAELQLFEQDCIGCGRCGERAHPEDAARCPSGALRMCGEQMTTDDIVRLVLRDRAYYGDEGGVTLSGGECLLQPDAAADILGRVKAEGVHTAVDTSGAVPWSAMCKTLDVCDLYLYDIKCIDAARHREFTGADNAQILDNARRLSGCGKPMWVRVPVIPGFNDDEDEMRRIAAFVRGLDSVARVTLMPYHTLGKSKYESLGMHCEYQGDPCVARERAEQYRSLFPVCDNII